MAWFDRHTVYQDFSNIRDHLVDKISLSDGRATRRGNDVVVCVTADGVTERPHVVTDYVAVCGFATPSFDEPIDEESVGFDDLAWPRFGSRLNQFFASRDDTDTGLFDDFNTAVTRCAQQCNVCGLESVTYSEQELAGIDILACWCYIFSDWRIVVDGDFVLAHISPFNSDHSVSARRKRTSCVNSGSFHFTDRSLDKLQPNRGLLACFSDIASPNCEPIHGRPVVVWYRPRCFDRLSEYPAIALRDRNGLGSLVRGTAVAELLPRLRERRCVSSV
jgi:hypothetical protein